MAGEDTDARRKTLRLQKLGRFLSLLLKHRSTRFPIQLDAEGFASIRDVMGIVKRLPNFRWASQADIKAVLDLPGPQRFELREGQGRNVLIRAIDERASSTPLAEPVSPPELLYYGTSPDNLESIAQSGITASDRQYVRLASNHAAARSIAVRVTPDPVILHIDATAALKTGILFYSTAPGIYLTEAVPSRFIQEFRSQD